MSDSGVTYKQVARVGKALASPKRLQLLELLAQGEEPVEALAENLSIDIRLASAHLKVMRGAGLVESRRDGKYIYYRLSGEDVARLWVSLREVADAHLAELKMALEKFPTEPAPLTGLSREMLLRKARDGEVVVIDVRARTEYEQAHLPFARSMPLAELEQRIAELPKRKQIVAYCRGPYCLLSDQAVALLQARGFCVRKTPDGISEWQAAGLPVQGNSPLQHGGRS